MGTGWAVMVVLVLGAGLLWLLVEYWDRLR